MVDHLQLIRIIKGYLTHLVALTLIGVFVFLLVKSAFNQKSLHINSGSGSTCTNIRQVAQKSPFGRLENRWGANP